MGTEIASVNLVDAAEQLREKIRQSFAELIPKEQWDELIKKEIEGFFKGAGFHATCQDVVQAHAKKLVKATLEAPEWAETWNSDKQAHGPSPLILQWLTDNHDKIVRAIIIEVFSTALQNFLYQARSR